MVNWNTLSFLPGQRHLVKIGSSAIVDILDDSQFGKMLNESNWELCSSLHVLVLNPYNGIENWINSLPCYRCTQFLLTGEATLNCGIVMLPNREWNYSKWFQKKIHNVVMSTHIWVLIVKAFQFTLKKYRKSFFFLIVFVNCSWEVFT